MQKYMTEKYMLSHKQGIDITHPYHYHWDSGGMKDEVETY